MKGLTVKKFKELLPTLCDRETSMDPDDWTPENPFLSHCAVVALLAQDVFGGVLLRASLENTEFAHMRSHYWNALPHGVFDFTAAQFGEHYPANLRAETRTREYVLSNPDTARRYALLAQRFSKAIALKEEP